MYTIKDIIAPIEELAPLSIQETYDNSGLLCGAETQSVKSVLLCVDITEEIVDEAVSLGCDLIISHHPLIFKGIKNLIPDNYINRCIVKALKNDIGIYSAHTNMDLSASGASGRMADKIGLCERRYISEHRTENYGYGIIGHLPAPEDSLRFLERIKSVFGCKGIRHTRIHKKEISHIAVCGGAGAFLIPDAIAKKADIFLSGDFKYHDFFLAENRIILADIGHYESEQYTKDIFYELIRKKFPKFAVRFSSFNTNPVNYL